MSKDSESSNRKSTLGISILFEMNNELLIDNVDKMYSKLGPFPSSSGKSSSLVHQPYIILEGGYYTGYTKNNNPEGSGCLLLNTGQIYEGCFKKGQIRGLGRMIDLDGSAYEGYWKRDDLKGQGKIIWLDGKTYEGKIKRIKPHGHGILRFPDSSYYSGKFVKGFMHGNGVLVWANGRIYAGEWRKNDMNGFGAMHWSDKYFFGSFKAGEISGIGKMQWNDGKAYLGEWTKGFRHGTGCMVEGNRLRQGRWESDEFVREEGLKELRVDKLTEILEEKVKELKNDENLEKFIEFSGIITKGLSDEESCAVVSELNESNMEVVKDQDSERESIWSTPDKLRRNQEEIELDLEADEELAGEDSVEGSEKEETQELEVHMPELHRFQSESIQSESIFKFHQPVLHLTGIESESEDQISLPGNIEPLLLTGEIRASELAIKSSRPSEYSEAIFIPEPYIRKEDFSNTEQSIGFEIQSADSSRFKEAVKINQPYLAQESEMSIDSGIKSFSSNPSDLKDTFFKKPHLEVPEFLESQELNEGEALDIPMHAVKEFELDPYISVAPVLVHAPQAAAPDNDAFGNLTLERIEEENESLAINELEETISTVFDDEDSEVEYEEVKYELPANADIKSIIKSKNEKENKEKDKPTFDGRLEKVLVVNSVSSSKGAAMKTSVKQNRPDGSIDFFSSSERSTLGPADAFPPLEQVVDKLQIQDIRNHFRSDPLIEIIDLLGPFEYQNDDCTSNAIKLGFVDWVQDGELFYCGQADSKGNRSGAGVEITPNCVYEGYWHMNRRHGLGRVITIDGDNFEGFWRNDYKHGFGTLWKYAGEGYVGDWDFDVPQGLGTEISALEIYEGGFDRGQRHGKGQLVQTNLTYTGEFFRGSIHGYGVIQWNNGSTFAGIFIEGESKGLKGAFIPTYNKTVYKRRQIRNKNLKEIKEEGRNHGTSKSSGRASHTSSDASAEDNENLDQSASKQSDRSLTPGEDDPKPVHLMKTLSEDSDDEPINSLNKLSVPMDPKHELSINSKASKSSQASNFAKPLAGTLAKPDDAKLLNMSHSDNQNLNDSRAEPNKLQFPDLDPARGIIKTSSISNDPNLSNLEIGIKFIDGVNDYSDEELQKRKAKFKVANKEKGIEGKVKKEK